MGVVEHGGYGLPWRPELADEIRDMRERLEASRTERDLKRGFGGIVDIEFLVQLFQVKYAHDRPSLRATNTWAALDALQDTGLLSEQEHAALRQLRFPSPCGEPVAHCA